MACECVNDEAMVVEMCDLITRCVLPVDVWSETGGFMDEVVGQGSRGQGGEITELIFFSI